MVNLHLKKCILKVINNQIRSSNPKCVKQTLERLIKAGYSENKAKEKIAAVLLEEIYFGGYRHWL